MPDKRVLPPSFRCSPSGSARQRPRAATEDLAEAFDEDDARCVARRFRFRFGLVPRAELFDRESSGDESERGSATRHV